MSGPDLQEIGKRTKLSNRTIELSRADIRAFHHARCGFEKVWATDRTYEHEITCKDPHRDIVPPPSSVKTKEMLSGVCPGVCKTSSLTFPT